MYRSLKTALLVVGTLFAPPLLSQQQPIIVDGTGATPGAFASITQAVANSVPGDTIFIRGMELNGDPVGYCETPYFPSQDPETFPIHLKPGLILKPLDSTAVHVWSTSPAPPAALFQIDPRPGAEVTRLVTLILGGGSIGVLIDGTAGGDFDATVKDVIFARNSIGLAARADMGGQVHVKVQDCRIHDGALVVPGGTSPVPQKQSIGLQFHATDQGTPGRVTAEVNNFKVVGNYLLSAMEPLDFAVEPHDLASLDKVTRVVEVFVDGVTPEHPDPVSDPEATQPIAEVMLAINGGVFDGNASVNAGWGIGIYAAADRQNSTGLPGDYYCGFDVTVTGATIQDFRHTGIYGTVGAESRGAFHLGGQTKLIGMGPQQAPGAALDGSGAIFFAEEGYLALHSADSTFEDNFAHGVVLDTPGTIHKDSNYPAGLFLEMLDTGIHGNGGHGLLLSASEAWDASGYTVQNGIVGGTWDTWQVSQNPHDKSLIADGEPTDLGHGQGVVDRCAISNNGGAGIWALSRAEGGSHLAITNVRFTNSFVWNNGGGAFLGQVQGEEAYLLTPLAHCTLVGQPGGSTPWTAEVKELPPSTGGTTTGYYEWVETRIGNPNVTKFVRNRLIDSIFQSDPQNPTVNDFGQELTGLLLEDTDPPGFLGQNSIGAVSCRAWPDTFYLEWTAADTPFSPSLDLALRDPIGLLLYPGPGGLTFDFDDTATFLSIDAPETNFDYLLNPRPDVVTGDRDKGAHQVQ